MARKTYTGLPLRTVFFALNVGERRLFDPVPEKAALGKDALRGTAQPFGVAYQVARLHTDILAMLADILQPIPADIFQYVESQEKQREFCAKLDVCWELDDGDTIAPLAGDWADARKLDTEYLRHGPDIWFLTTGDSVKIHWCTEGEEAQGVKIWTAGNGEIEFGIERFLEEVTLFHQDLTGQMAARIELIKQNGLPAEMSIDTALLDKDHFDRLAQLDTALGKAPVTKNWQEVGRAVARVGKINV